MLSEDHLKKVLMSLNEEDWKTVFQNVEKIGNILNQHCQPEIETLNCLMEKANIENIQPSKELQEVMMDILGTITKSVMDSPSSQTDNAAHSEKAEPKAATLHTDRFPELDAATQHAMQQQFSKKEATRLNELSDVFSLLRSEVLPDLYEEYTTLQARYHELNRRFGTENCLKFALLNMDISEVRNNNLQ